MTSRCPRCGLPLREADLTDRQLAALVGMIGVIVLIILCAGTLLATH